MHMKSLLMSLLKIGTTVATVAISTACGADKNTAIAIGSMVGTAVSGTIDLSIKELKNEN